MKSLIPALMMFLVAVNNVEAEVFDLDEFPSLIDKAVTKMTIQSVVAGKAIKDKSMEVSRIMSRESEAMGNGCSCQHYTCGCCAQVKVKEVHLNDKVCLNISYLPKEIGVKVALILNGKMLFSEEVSVENPPPICAAIPYLKQLASLCLRFNKLKFGAGSFSGCAQIEVRLEGMVLEKVNLGCFRLP